MSTVVTGQSRFARFAQKDYWRRIYLRDQIKDGKRGFLDEDIVRLESKMKNFAKVAGGNPLVIDIDSIGGSRKGGMHFTKVIAEYPADVYGLVTGVCNSSAFLVLQSCHTRLALPDATLTPHNNTLVLGDVAFTPDDDHEVFGDLAKHIIEHLQQRRVEVATRLQARLKHFTVEEVIGLMKRMPKFTAEEALAQGLIDEIVRV